jgi:hypothetical protein
MLDQHKDDPSSAASIIYGNNGRGKVLGCGKVAIVGDITLEIILLVEPLDYNSISISQLATCGYDTTFSLHYEKVFRGDSIKAYFVGHVKDNLYLVDLSKESLQHVQCSKLSGVVVASYASPCRYEKSQYRLKGKHIVGLAMSVTNINLLVQSASHHECHHTVRPLEILHMDLFGPNLYNILGAIKPGNGSTSKSKINLPNYCPNILDPVHILSKQK